MLGYGVDKKKNNSPSLDLSFAYGTTIVKQLTEHDIRTLEAAEALAEEIGHSEDPTIRTITSLYSGKRGIKGLLPPQGHASDSDDED